jgi:AraC-like DNA-binding protein
MAVSIIFARALAAQVHQHGVEPDLLLRSCQIEPARLHDLRESLTTQEADLLVRKAAEITRDAGIGLTIGATAPLSMLQVVGHLMRAQSTLRDALGVLRRFSLLLAHGVAYDLLESGGLASFVFEPAAPPGDSLRAGVEFTLAMTARIGRHFAPRKAGLCEVHFAHAAPIYLARYNEIFGCPVLFGQPQNALVFPRSYLDVAQPHADETTRSTFEQAAHRMLLEKTQHCSAVVKQVRALLYQTKDLSQVRIDRIASQVGLNTRALRRRLGSEGAPFSSLVNEARCRFACEQLRRPESTIKGTAALLGFTETSSFHRAFKRWTGRTPARLIHELRVPMTSATESAAL